jgi:transcriptional regulator with XRE-family HTH domain
MKTAVEGQLTKVGTSPLRALRQSKGWTQQQLADRARVDERTIRRIESHPERCNTKWATLKRIADQFDVEPTNLLGSKVPHLLEHGQIEPGKLDHAWLANSDVLFIWDLAELLRCSVRTLKRVRASRPWDLPRPIPARIDQRTRWWRTTVVAWLSGDLSAAGSVATAVRTAVGHRRATSPAEPLKAKTGGRPRRTPV